MEYLIDYLGFIDGFDVLTDILKPFFFTVFTSLSDIKAVVVGHWEEMFYIEKSWGDNKIKWLTEGRNVGAVVWEQAEL